jgi:predicted pyridoxine 5'-phosphate oxidase superfamily flavin-nucleotide-binding protein
MIVKGHRPILALVIEIEEVFHHCSKAFLRSQLWRHETWTDPVPPQPTNPPTCQNPVGLWPNWVLTSRR